MDKIAASVSPPAMLIKKGTSAHDTKIDKKLIDELIDTLTQYKNTRNPTLLNFNEPLNVLLFFDEKIPMPALCLLCTLRPSVVTFVTHIIHEETSRYDDTKKFFENEKAYCTFVKEVLSSISVKKQHILEFSELEISNKKKDFKNICNVAFVGIIKGKKSYTKKIEVANEGLNILEKNINCSMENLPLRIWYLDEEEEDDSHDSHYLHIVNLDNHRDKHLEQIQAKLKKMIFENSVHNLPLSWFLLYLKIQKFCNDVQKPFMEYYRVLELWNTESINSETELKRALKFFHHIGALFYFSSVEGISDLVFTDLCCLFDELNCFYSCKDATCGCDKAAKLVLKFEGILKSRMVEEINSPESKTMQLQHFLNLLKHLKFIAPLRQNDYFFPSFLNSYDDKSILPNYKPSSCPPLLITFSSGSLYRNIFCYLAAHIIEKIENEPEKGWSKPKYDKSESQYTFKDLIVFCVGAHHRVCITDKTFFLEIKVYSQFGDNCPHYTVFKFIKESLEEITEKKLKLPDHYKYGFPCCRCASEREQHEHLMIINNLDNFNEAYCSRKDILQELTEEHSAWFTEVCKKIAIILTKGVILHDVAHLNQCRYVYVWCSSI